MSAMPMFWVEVPEDSIAMEVAWIAKHYPLHRDRTLYRVSVGPQWRLCPDGSKKFLGYQAQYFTKPQHEGHEPVDTKNPSH